MQAEVLIKHVSVNKLVMFVQDVNLRKDAFAEEKC